MRGILLLAIMLGCGGAGSAATPADPGSAFRSVGPPPIPVPPVRPAGEAGGRSDYYPYYPNGRLRSHGYYAVRGDRAVARGVFTFWTAAGTRQAQGRYQDGLPVGCFALWLRGGARVTGLADQGDLRPADCEPPSHPAAEVLELEHGGAGDPVVDVSFETFVAPGASVGARTTRYATDDPEIIAAVMAIWRRHVGAWRFGGAASVRPAEDSYGGITGSGLAGWGRQATSWLDLEVWSELGLLWVHARPELEDHRSAVENVWTPFAAVQGEVALRIGREIELTAGGRFELRYPRNIYRQTSFCAGGTAGGLPAPCDTLFDTWRMGGIAAGAVLGLRFLVW
jgi:hypothetical protein